ncbi:MAG: IS1634 family transposase, partial [Thaumarchaeota archaeon]|nr:IS1634 family transposase [Nitrososphaerota archaeon]
ANEISKHFFNIENMACYKSWNHGIPALAASLFKQLGIDTILLHSLSKVSNKSYVSKLIESMVINRLDDPCSKLKLLDWMDQSSLQFILDIPPPGMKLHVNSFYRAMDYLWERRDLIEKKIFDNIVKPRSSKSGVIAKDLTSTYLEGEESPLADYGYSRDHHRPDLKQVTWSLIETEEGYPVTPEVYRGNTVDKSTLKESVERLKKIFGITSGIFIIDRGIATEENIQFLAREGFSHLASESVRDVQEIVDEALSFGLEEGSSRSQRLQTMHSTDCLAMTTRDS